MPELELEDGARLLARWARRPFCQEDFGAAGGAPLAYSDELLRQLRASPVMERLRGHPGRIVEAAAQVRKELPSLLQHPRLGLGCRETDVPCRSWVVEAFWDIFVWISAL